jgi:hypothetical protein
MEPIDGRTDTGVAEDLEPKDCDLVTVLTI